MVLKTSTGRHFDFSKIVSVSPLADHYPYQFEIHFQLMDKPIRIDADQFKIPYVLSFQESMPLLKEAVTKYHEEIITCWKSEVIGENAIKLWKEIWQKK